MCNLSPRGVVGQVLVREGSAVGEKPAYGSVRATTSVSMKRSKHSTLAKVFCITERRRYYGKDRCSMAHQSPTRDEIWTTGERPRFATLVDWRRLFHEK